MKTLVQATLDGFTSLYRTQIAKNDKTSVDSVTWLRFSQAKAPAIYIEDLN